MSVDPATSGEIKKLRAENATLRTDMDRKTKRSGYFWLVMVVTSVVAAGGSYGMSAYNTRQSEQKLCAIVVLSDDAYRKTPPTTELGRQQARNFSVLRRAYGCPPYQEEKK
jgi:hypothetical protein